MSPGNNVVGPGNDGMSTTVQPTTSPATDTVEAATSPENGAMSPGNNVVGPGNDAMSTTVQATTSPATDTVNTTAVPPMTRPRRVVVRQTYDEFPFDYDANLCGLAPYEHDSMDKDYLTCLGDQALAHCDDYYEGKEIKGPLLKEAVIEPTRGIPDPIEKLDEHYYKILLSAKFLGKKMKNYQNIISAGLEVVGEVVYVFVSTEKTISPAHHDPTNSMLYITHGRKEICIAPPTDRGRSSNRNYHSNPFVDGKKKLGPSSIRT